MSSVPAPRETLPSGPDLACGALDCATKNAATAAMTTGSPHRAHLGADEYVRM
jgi:hypothetical protein